MTRTEDIQIDLRPTIIPPDDDLSALLPIDLNAEQEPRVNARDLHGFLESRQEFTNWVANRVKECQLVKDEDYGVCLMN